MPKIDFYTLSQTTEEERARFACRLVEKAFNLGHRVYLHTDSEHYASQLDDLLWHYKPESFLPHALSGEMDAEEVPILIGFGASYQGPPDLLVNLSREVPAFYADFQRVSEIVIDDEAAKQVSRQHWKHYQSDGHNPEVHKL